MDKRPNVGIGIIVQKDGQTIMGLRIGKHGKNKWSVPGGYLEFGETFEECAAREMFEETNVKIKNIKKLTTVNNVFKNEDHHSITVFMTAEIDSGQPRTTEPDKFIKVGWYDLKNPPGPLFLPLIQLEKAKPDLF